MMVLLFCALVFVFENSGAAAGVNNLLGLFTNEFILIAYLTINLVITDWEFSTQVGKASGSFFIMGGIGIMCMIAVRILSQFM